jgi:hypothetical protein
MDSARVNLVYIPDSDSSKDININEFIAAINKMFAPPPGSKPKSPKVNIGEVVLANSFFSLHHPDRDSIENGFDHNHFKLRLDDSELSAFKVIGDTIQFNLHSMVGTELDYNWPIHELKTFYRISQGGMEFLNLSVKAGKSFVSDSVVFKYQSLKDLNDFVNQVSVTADLRKCVIHPDDILFFAPQTGRLPESFHLSGYAYGKIKHFYLDDMDLEMGKSQVTGNLEMDGLPSIRDLY